MEFYLHTRPFTRSWAVKTLPLFTSPSDPALPGNSRQTQGWPTISHPLTTVPTRKHIEFFEQPIWRNIRPLTHWRRSTSRNRTKTLPVIYCWRVEVRRRSSCRFNWGMSHWPSSISKPKWIWGYGQRMLITERARAGRPWWWRITVRVLMIVRLCKRLLLRLCPWLRLRLRPWGNVAAKTSLFGVVNIQLIAVGIGMPIWGDRQIVHVLRRGRRSGRILRRIWGCCKGKIQKVDHILVLCCLNWLGQICQDQGFWGGINRGFWSRCMNLTGSSSWCGSWSISSERSLASSWSWVPTLMQLAGFWSWEKVNGNTDKELGTW